MTRSINPEIEIRGDSLISNLLTLAFSGIHLIKQEPLLFLVEDSDPYRIFLQRILEEKGYCVLAFRNGAEAYAMLSTHTPEAIISDIEMPEMDGWAFRKAMNNTFPEIDIPFVYITSRNPDETDPKARSLGVEYCFFKPLKIPYFLSNLSQLLASRKTAKAGIVRRA